uniref:Sushi domain containing 1 n=1 Tax=Varanus komodoensis TaxID=61221 RepID=A0A8D2L118_VARKO
MSAESFIFIDAVLSDVCASCHANATCQKRDGKDVCICNYGFVGNGRTFCQDKDECLFGTSKICGEHTSCHNTHGSFYCVCLDGFQASSKNKIFIPNDGTNCRDIDECEISDICGLGGRCVNTAGSYECYCIEGYQLENGTEPFHSATQKHSCKGESVDCGPPPSLPNAYSTPADKTTYGSKVVYTCQPNYVIESGNWTAVCNSRGQWEGADMVCKEISCGKPPLIVNSEIKWNRTSRLGSVAEYKCINNSYPTSIKRHSFCTRNGSWEILDLRCESKYMINISIFNDTCIRWQRESERTQLEETYVVSEAQLLRVMGKEEAIVNQNSSCSRLGGVSQWQLPHPQLGQSSWFDQHARPPHMKQTLLQTKGSQGGLLFKKRREGSNKQTNHTEESSLVSDDRTVNHYSWCLIQSLAHALLQFHIQGLRWYQKKFCHTMALNFTTDSWTPEVCFYLHPGTNYTVNISSANSNQQSATVYMMTPITGKAVFYFSFSEPQSPEVEFITVHGSVPLFSLKKAEERNGPISSYQVIAIPWSSQCDFNCYSLTSLSFFSKGTDSGGYVAAEFPAHVIADNMVDFALGDRLYYGKFYNAPLKKGKDYCIILKTISEWNGVRMLLSLFVCL